MKKDIDRHKGRLYEDLTLAQTLHPELSPMLRSLCFELFNVEMLIEKDCVTIGCTQASNSFYSRFQAVQVLKSQIIGVKH